MLIGVLLIVAPLALLIAFARTGSLRARYGSRKPGGLFTVVFWVVVVVVQGLVVGSGLVRAFLQGPLLVGALAGKVDASILGVLAVGLPVTILTGIVASQYWAIVSWKFAEPGSEQAGGPTLWETLRRVTNIRTIKAGGGANGDDITIGVDNDTGHMVSVSMKELAGHTLLLGATGAGKTYTAVKLLEGTIRQKRFTAIIDVKGSPELVRDVTELCEQYDRPLHVFSAQGPCSYDPFLYGDYTQRRDLMIGIHTWSEEHYKSRAADYLLVVFYMLEITGIPAGSSWIEEVRRLLNPAELAALRSSLPAAHAKTKEAQARAQTVLGEVYEDPRSISGLSPRIRLLTDTTLGYWFRPNNHPIDMRSIYDNDGVVLFSLPSLKYQEATATFGNLVIQDLKTLAGNLEQEGLRKPGLIFVDEFQRLNPDLISHALEQSRSSGLMWVLATQDLGTIEKAHQGRALVETVLNNTNLKIIHSIQSADSAHRVAELAGQRWDEQGFKVNVIQPTNLQNQGMGEKSTFTLLSKFGEYVISNARAVKTESHPPAGERTNVHHVPPAMGSDEVYPDEMMDWFLEEGGQDVEEFGLDLLSSVSPPESVDFEDDPFVQASRQQAPAYSPALDIAFSTPQPPPHPPTASQEPPGEPLTLDDEESFW